MYRKREMQTVCAHAGGSITLVGSNDSRNAASLSPFKGYSCIYIFPKMHPQSTRARLETKHVCCEVAAGHVTPLLLPAPTNGSAPTASSLFLSAALTRARSQTAPEFRHRNSRLAGCRGDRRGTQTHTRCTHRAGPGSSNCGQPFN